MNINKFNDRIGEINYNKYGSKMTIVEYINGHNIFVKFENGYVVHTHYGHFKDGGVKNPYDKSVLGVGYIGEGDYNVSKNNKVFGCYHIWRNMLIRCYSHEYQKNKSTYIGCSVCEEWHNFQNFAKWFEENYYQIENFRMDLDKDILIKGNKVYSPETCCFVPQSINSIFLKCDKIRGDFPVGVYFHKNTKKYVSHYNNGKGKQITLGYFNTPEEAFYVYKKAKEDYIKEVADEYKDRIPKKLYDALINYEVEVTD